MLRTCLFWLFIGVIAASVVAQAAALSAADSSAVPEGVKLVLTEAAPKIDGVMAEGEWAGARKAVLDKQYEPQENAAATERTEVYFLYDKENLYIAFHAFDGDPAAIRAPVSKRDDIALDDKVEIWLDTFDDRRRTYAFRFNPLGIQEDGIFTDGDFGNLNWDGILTSKGTITKDGYVVEVAIPFKTLRYQINKEKRWGMHLFRRIARKQENTTWMPISRDRESFLIQMGSLEGLDGIKTGRTLDVIPTVTLSRNGTREADPTLPFGARLNEVNKLDIGVTATYAITPNLILSATVNPDFSQVEADVPQVSVNQRFPLFFAEKRPFFLEGAEVFRSFYSAAPRVIDTRQIVDPDWGIKLTGKIGKNTLGILSASDRAPGLQVPPTNQNFGKNAQFNIFRYGRDVFEQSSIGFSFTDRRFAGASNSVLTADSRFRIGDKHLFSYQLSYSKTTDLTGVKREGSSIYLVYNYEDRKWDFGTSQSGMGRNFRAQTGFIRRTGFLRSYGYIGRTFRPKEKSWWVKVRPFVVALAFRDERGNLDESFVDPGVDMEFARGINLYTYFSTTRDNFLGSSYTTRQYVARWSVSTFEKISASGVFRIGTGVNFDPARPQLGNLLDNTLNITIKPISKVNSEFLWLKSSLASRTGGGEKLFAQDIYRNRAVYQFNRFNAVRSIIDYDTFSRRIGVSLLYGYTPRPNTAFYVGYGDALFNGLDPLTDSRRPGLVRQSRSLFAKASYNFRF